MNFTQLWHRALAFRGPVIRAIIFAAAWYLLPAWLFVIVALYLYFVPFFHSAKFFPFFCATMLVYFLAPTTLGYALVGGVLFGLLLSIKEMIFIDRRTAYEVAIIAVIFFLLRLFYRAQMQVGGLSLILAFLMAFFMGWLFKSLVERFPGETTEEVFMAPNTAAWLFVLFIWQAMMAVLFLPVDFVYQTAISFLLAVPILDLFSNHLSKSLSREKIFFTVSVIFAGLVLVLASAPLGL